MGKGLSISVADLQEFVRKGVTTQEEVNRALGRTTLENGNTKIKGKLRRRREPNKTERDYGLLLEAMRQRGEIEYFGFEEITLRWAGMTYTPDYFVIVWTERHDGIPLPDQELPAMIQVRYIEIKGAHKWEDSIVKYKAAKDRFHWAEFQMWQRIDGRFEQIG